LRGYRNTRPLTVSNNKKISNDNFRVTTHKKNDTSKQPFKKYNGTTVLNIENLEIPKDKVWVLWEITVPVKQPFLVGFNPTFNRYINNGILVNASEDWKPLQLLLLTKAFDRLFDTGRVLLFHWRFTRSKQG
jgi:hypothetical protein